MKASFLFSAIAAIALVTVSASNASYTAGPGSGIYGHGSDQLDTAYSAPNLPTSAGFIGTRINVDLSTPVFLPAGTYQATGFSAEVGQSGNLQPFLAIVNPLVPTATATGAGSDNFSVIASGMDNTITTGSATLFSNGFGANASGSDSFIVPAGGETVYAGITNDDQLANNPVYTNTGLTLPGNMNPPLDDHNNPGAGPYIKSSVVTGFSNPGLNREYAFSITITPTPEPATLGLLSLGGLGLLARRRRA